MKSKYSEEQTGKILIPQVIDDLTREEPDRILYPTLQSNEEDIHRLHALAGSDHPSDDSTPLSTESEETLTADIRKAVKDLTELEGLGDNDDFFAAGIDSLQVLSLQRSLKKGLPTSDGRKSRIKTSLIYENPTIKLLSRALWALGSTEQNISLPSREEARIRMMRALIEKYTSGFPLRSKSRIKQVTDSQAKNVVVLTGSTGSLGSYVLETLINSSTIHEIWCLNRSGDAEQRQTKSNNRRGLTTNWKANNVHFRHADLSKKRLGLPAEDFAYLIRHATTLIHTQWQVDFNLALPSFEQHIAGVRNIVDFAIAVSQKDQEIAIFFTSSTGVATNWNCSDPVPERAILDVAVARGGYAESKLVAEYILMEAAQRSAVDVTISRVGQIAGPVQKQAENGMWNRKEWLPSIIDSSARLGLVPATLGRNNFVDWIPVDILAEIISQLAFAVHDSGTGRVFHLVNPLKTSWEELVPAVLSRLDSSGKDSKITVIPWNKWVDALIGYGLEQQNMEALSALKLIDFFQSLNLIEGQSRLRAAFGTITTARSCKTFEQLPAVNEKWMRIWLDQWGFGAS